MFSISCNPELKLMTAIEKCSDKVQCNIVKILYGTVTITCVTVAYSNLRTKLENELVYIGWGGGVSNQDLASAGYNNNNNNNNLLPNPPTGIIHI
jgi:hypothetical protein